MTDSILPFLSICRYPDTLHSIPNQRLLFDFWFAGQCSKIYATAQHLCFNGHAKGNAKVLKARVFMHIPGKLRHKPVIVMCFRKGMSGSLHNITIAAFIMPPGQITGGRSTFCFFSTRNILSLGLMLFIFFSFRYTRFAKA